MGWWSGYAHRLSNISVPSFPQLNERWTYFHESLIRRAISATPFARNDIQGKDHLAWIVSSEAYMKLTTI